MELTDCEFDFDARVQFGANEGIYIDCSIKGHFDENEPSDKTQILHCGTFKTLGTTLEGMHIMGELAGGVVWDVSDVSTAKSAVEQANNIFGDICVYVNNAGILCNDDVDENAVDFFGKTEKGLRIHLMKYLTLLMDNGHYHPTEMVSDKISSLLLFNEKDSPSYYKTCQMGL